MVSVERVLEYCKLPSEAPLETDENHKPAENWPNDGEISVSNASLKYQDESPNTLKNLTFKIYGNEKVNNTHVKNGKRFLRYRKSQKSSRLQKHN